MKASQPTSTSAGVVPAPLRIRAASPKLEPLDTSRPTARKRANSNSVTSGPAVATLNSSEALWGWRRMCSSPPKNHRSMPTTGIPILLAASAWPSSCRTSETKYPSAPATPIA